MCHILNFAQPFRRILQGENLRLKHPDSIYGLTLVGAFFLFLLVNYAFPSVLDYLFIVVFSYYIVEYSMGRFDSLSARYPYYHTKFILLLIGIFVSTVFADVWLHFFVPVLDKLLPEEKALLATSLEIASVMATMQLTQNDKSP
jgi:hypothetical protein